MPYGLQHRRGRLPRRVASAVNQGQPVRSSASQTDYVLPAATSNVRVLGVALATGATPGDGVTVQTEGIAICQAAASIGAGAQVIVGSTNGRLAPLGAAASAPIPQGLNVVGESVNAAADGDYFSVLLRTVSA